MPGRAGSVRWSRATCVRVYGPTATCCATRSSAGRPDERCGLSWVPDGDAAYAATLRQFTTTTKTAQGDPRHRPAQIEKLADEYRSLGPEVVGTDDLSQIFKAMRSEPRLHFTDGDELITASEVAMQRAWNAMPDWFEVLPQAPCAVQPTTTEPGVLLPTRR